MSQSLSLLVDEDARRRFESAWSRGEAADISSYLPDPSDDRYLGTLFELVAIDLEMRHQSPPAPTVEEYLNRFPLLAEPVCLKRLLEEDFELRRQNGDRPEIGDYRDRFPQLDWTNIHFETMVETRHDAARVAEAYPKIPGLEIERILGQGGMGIVYRARQTRLDRTVAVKQVLSASGIISADDLARFKNEALAVASLGHPNIVPVYEIGEEQGRPFLILEFMPGGTLAKKLNRQPQPPHEAAATIRLLANAVQAVHNAGFLHRDLKPGNILLSGDGTPKITDFGLTKRVADAASKDAPLTESGAIVGTPHYMAPEQAAGRNREVGPSADIYALGAILYEMLTGRPPFQGQSPMDIVMQVVSREPLTPRKLLPGIPADLETVCMKCLEKDPRRRYESAQALADDLQRFLNGEPIRARAVGRVERAWRWCRRKPAQAALAAVVGMVLIGSAIGGVVWREARLDRERAEIEEEKKKLADRARHLEELRESTKQNLALAQRELQAGRWVAAREFLRQSHDHIKSESTLRDLGETLEHKLDDVDRLVTFTAQADLAERQAFLENDSGSLQRCETALNAMRVFESPDSWWKKLPVEDLRPEQSAKLERDVAHQLLLFALLTIKEGNDETSKNEKSKKDDTTSKVLGIIKLHNSYCQAKKMPESMTGRILEGYCYASQFRFDKIRRLNGQEPETASDCYFLGIALFWAGQQPNDWISRAVLVTFPLLGVPVGEPKQTADRLLRRAVAEEPGHYWSHFWLGWCLLSQTDFAGSELTFTTCTTLRPEEGLAYAERARVLAFNAARAKEGPIRDGLVRRVVADAEKADHFGAGDWYVQIPLMHAFVVLQKQKEASAAAGKVLELMTLPRLLPTRSRNEQEALLKELAFIIDFRDPVDPAETQSLLGLACVFMKRDDEALRHADEAAKFSPEHPRIHLVRGIIHLRRKNLDPALAEFDAVLRDGQRSFLAGVGRARALELQEKHELSLKSYTALLDSAVNDGQRLAALLGCHRNLKHLGRDDDAAQALARAKAIDPKPAP